MMALPRCAAVFAVPCCSLDGDHAMKVLNNRVRQYLDQNNIAYTCLPHRRDYTARQTAHDCRLKPADFAKVVGVNADGRQVLAVLPADHDIDLPRFQEQLGAGHLELLSEHALASFFPDCELGACPPIGNLYGLSVYIAPSLTRHETITFNASTHEEAIQMPYAAFEQLVHPTVMDFSLPVKKCCQSKCEPAAREKMDAASRNIDAVT